MVKREGVADSSICRVSESDAGLQALLLCGVPTEVSDHACAPVDLCTPEHVRGVRKDGGRWSGKWRGGTEGHDQQTAQRQALHLAQGKEHLRFAHPTGRRFAKDQGFRFC